MELKTTGVAGTLESGDIYVEVTSGGSGIDIDLQSSVMSLYGRQIKTVITETLAELGVSGARITANDKGALDCTIRARVTAAVYRSAERQDYTFAPKGGK